MEPDLIFKGVLLVSLVQFLWHEYLAWRQFCNHRDNEQRPDYVSQIVSEEDYRKARLYKLDKHRFGFVHSLWGEIESTLVLICCVLPFFWNLSTKWVGIFGYNHEILVSLVFVSTLILLESAISLPWGLYDTFVVEQLHGFNKQTLGFYLKDKIKQLLLSLALLVPILSSIICIIDWGGDYFFIYMWLFMLVISLFLMTIYPEFIAPLFDKYTPLPDGELRQKIEALAVKVGFPLTKLFVVEGSKRSAHSNAYMYGFWNNKRIVLYDTLISDYTPVQRGDEQVKQNDQVDGQLEQTNETERDERAQKAENKMREKLGMSTEEVVAVLGHELGHWALWHTLLLLCIAQLNLLLMFCMFAYFYQQPELYLAFGFTTQPKIIGLLIVVQFIAAPFNELLSFALTLLSRRLEFSADNYSSQLGYAHSLCSGLIKLSKDNLSLPIDDWLYSVCSHSHPPIPERIQAMKKYL